MDRQTDTTPATHNYPFLHEVQKRIAINLPAKMISKIELSAMEMMFKLKERCKFNIDESGGAEGN
jgi:hypothetical protein